MWGAHTVAQILAGLVMANVTSIEFEYAGPQATMVTRLSNGVRLVLVLVRVSGSVWEQCEYWQGSCGERFDGPEGWAAAGDGYARTEVSSPKLLREYKKVLADYTARTQRPMHHIRDFLNCIRSRRLTVANPDVMYRSMGICLAADICGQLQRNLKFGLVKTEFVGDPEANRLRVRAMRAPLHGLNPPSDQHAMKPLCFVLLLLAGTAFAQEDQLIAILKSDAPLKEKADASQELARVGSRQAVPVLAQVPADATEAGFTPIFNGNDLTGWDGKPDWWKVEDGALTAESTPEKPCEEPNYLIWRGGHESQPSFLLRC